MSIFWGKNCISLALLWPKELSTIERCPYYEERNCIGLASLGQRVMSTIEKCLHFKWKKLRRREAWCHKNSICKIMGLAGIFGKSTDCEQSVFFFRFSKGSARARERALSGEAARSEKRWRVRLPSRAFSHARGHLRVWGALLNGPRKKRDYP